MAEEKKEKVANVYYPEDKSEFPIARKVLDGYIKQIEKEINKLPEIK